MAEDEAKLARALKQVREELNRATKDKQAENKRRDRKQSFFARFVPFRKVDGGRASGKHVPAPAQQKQKSQLDIEMVSWTRAVAGYTKWLVVVGAVAAGIAYFTLNAIQGQLGEMQATGRQTDDLIKATKQAADAATQAATSTIALERPRFFVLVKVGASVSKEGPFDSVASPPLHFTITNMGRAPGILRSMYARCYLQRGKLPDLPIVDPSQMRFAQSAVAAGLTTPDYPCEFEQPFSKQDWLDVAANTAIPIYTAVLVYEGPLDFTYIDTVSYRIDPFNGGLIYPLGLKNYTDDQTQSGRISKGAIPTIPNILWTTTKTPSSGK